MIKKLPSYYRKSETVKTVYSAIQKALDKTDTDILAEDLKLFITTTTDFELHEKDTGLTEIIADIETKRARIISRLQGNSVLTRQELENLIRIYDKTGVSITEDFESYTVTILFSGRTGKPYNINQIKAAVDEVKPAQLMIFYEYQKNTWNDLKVKLGTWGNAKTQTWDSAAEYDGRTWLFVDNGEVYLQENNANAYVVFIDSQPYARLL